MLFGLINSRQFLALSSANNSLQSMMVPFHKSGTALTPISVLVAYDNKA
jgi:hypothetical protein